MEVHAAMSASRINTVFSGRFLSPRLVLCVLLGALCLLAFPRRSAQTSAGFTGSQQVAGGGEGSSQNLNSAAARVASMGRRAAITQLPVPGWNPGAPLSMASEDFDGDGVPDLVIGHAGPPDFSLSLYRGNEDAVYPGNPGARERRSLSKLNEPPALSPLSSFPLVDAPDFLVTGDFNGDGHLDVAAAARGGDALYLLAGDGQGDFNSIKKIGLPGRVTAVGATQTGDTAGFAYVGIGIVDKSGPAALLLRSLDDASGAEPAVIRLPAAATAIAFRRADSRSPAYVLIGAGRELLVVRSDSGNAEAATGSIQHWIFTSVINSVAVGSFVSGHSSDVAVLTADGTVSLLTETSGGLNGAWGGETFSLGAWPGSTQLIRARISGSQADDLVLVDPTNHQLHVLVEDTTIADSSTLPLFQSRVSVSLDIDGEPGAVLPMHLNADALSDLVILRSGNRAPSTVVTQAILTFTVTTTADNGDNMNPTPGSLRQAIIQANANPGLDTIVFTILGPAPHTIVPPVPLPTITDPVTIDGIISQPDFAGTPVIELNGASAGAGANGLNVSTNNSLVKGLVINRFSGNGIVLNGTANMVKGNFIGTNATGSLALGNSLDGVLISGGSGNTVGGTTPAERNVLSGNRNGVQVSGPATGNQVRGNFIGTNAAGTAGVGNSANGVLISGSSGNSVGAPDSASSSNTIAFNGASGVAVVSGTGNPILTNSIFSNGGLGIDLGPTGVTLNDPGDGDSGANNLQNFPVLNSANAAGTSTTIQGTLNSTANTLFRIEFFASQVSNPSGFGEGQTFIPPATLVTTDASGNATFNPTLPVTVAPGQIITATATDPGNNTSEFSKSIQVGGLSGGTPADLSVIASIAPNPVETGSQITKTIVVSNAGPATAASVTVTDVLSANTTFVSCNSTGGGVCGGSGNNRTITFASLASGSTAVITIVASVNCSVSNGSIIGNTATVFSSTTPDPNPSNNVATATTIASNPAPRITCPANITQANDPGKCTATVNYFVPIAADNCPIFNVVCSPPSGSSFAIGTTTVTCVATDGGGLTTTCSFTVTVNDIERIAVFCPANVTVTASAGQCSPVVNFSSPTAIDNCPGSSVSCAPPSGSAFPLGVTSVLCTAVDAKGVQATCVFTVTVIGTPQAVVRLEGNGAALEFGPVSAARKIKKLKKQPVRTFTIENIGCTQLILTFDSLLRTGVDVDRGFISDPDDRALFNLSIVDAAGTETPLDILTDVRIGAGQKQNFKIRFNPLIPAVAKGTRGLSARDALPDLINSVLTFTQNGGAALRIRLVGHIDTALTLIDPVDPRRPPFIAFSRVEDEFIIEYSIYDSNLDVSKATYQLFDKKKRPVGQPITVDLTALIRQTGFVTGQSFTIAQRITGAKNHPEIVGVEVTVSDGESSDTVTSASTFGTIRIQALSERSFVGIKLFVPELALPEGNPRAH